MKETGTQKGDQDADRDICRMYVDRDLKARIAALKVVWNLPRDSDVVRRLFDEAKPPKWSK